MSANTDTTMALPTRRDRTVHSRPRPGRPGPYRAACRPESRWKPACEPGTACPRHACGDRRCQASSPENESGAPANQTRPTHDRERTGPDREAQRTELWSPGANRSRTPITAGPSMVADDHPTPTDRRPSPSRGESPGQRTEDEWSPGRMHGVVKPSWSGRFAAKMRGESGMSTAEYAVGTLAAVAFAGVLLKVLTSGPVQSALSSLIERALS